MRGLGIILLLAGVLLGVTCSLGGEAFCSTSGGGSCCRSVTLAVAAATILVVVDAKRFGSSRRTL
ncbi:unnamed protein product [Brassica oleracea]|uniref:(rape) hypothetical protein n=1 Tax=Brassica napus TaxID=3708 RepID=A0A816VM84_BRANA|nr:unnamed protein product [Brassica napus]